MPLLLLWRVRTAVEEAGFNLQAGAWSKLDDELSCKPIPSISITPWEDAVLSLHSSSRFVVTIGTLWPPCVYTPRICWMAVEEALQLSTISVPVKPLSHASCSNSCTLGAMDGAMQTTAAENNGNNLGRDAPHGW